MGFSDLDKHFHLSGLGLVSAEGVDEYQFMLESLIHGITQVTNEQLKPNAVVGDSTAVSISKAVKNTFDGSVSRINCWAHVMMNTEKQQSKNPDNKLEFKNDVRSLQLSFDQSKLENGYKLLRKDWGKKKYRCYLDSTNCS